MCILCYGLTGEEHWTDARVGQEPRASVRARRRRMLTQILAAHRIDYSDDPSGFTALIADRKGSIKVVRSLGEVWDAAETLAGQPLDPLEPALLSALSREP